jgi:hypothetical protein
MAKKEKQEGKKQKDLGKKLGFVPFKKGGKTSGKDKEK